MSKKTYTANISIDDKEAERKIKTIKGNRSQFIAALIKRAPLRWFEQYNKDPKIFWAESILQEKDSA